MTAKYPSTLAPLNHGAATFSILLEIFQKLFPVSGTVLELSSGEGYHISRLPTSFPKLKFIATEADSFNLERISNSCLEQNSSAVVRAEKLDYTIESDWENVISSLKGEKVDGIFGVNFFHMITDESIEKIFQQLSLILKDSGFLLIYGPFKLTSTAFLTESDELFDKMIKARPSEVLLGLKSIEALEKVAKAAGWKLAEKIELPKGNFGLVWRKL